VGKTRLAGAVAGRVAARFAGGVWLAELAAVGDPAGAAVAVAVALGVREQAGVPAAEAVARVLTRRPLLLVLDNCEHVIGAAAALCGGPLAACDDVRVLATSRERLRIAGEAAYRLVPLPVPGPGASSAMPAARSWWGTFGLVSLTAGLGALAAALLVCAALAAPHNRASPPNPPAGAT
jgi:predicted ATPase